VVTVKKASETEAKQAAAQRSEAKYDCPKKAFLRKLEPHIQLLRTHENQADGNGIHRKGHTDVSAQSRLWRASSI